MGRIVITGLLLCLLLVECAVAWQPSEEPYPWETYSWWECGDPCLLEDGEYAMACMEEDGLWLAVVAVRQGPDLLLYSYYGNCSDEPLYLHFETGEFFDLSLWLQNELRWRFGRNRFYTQSQEVRMMAECDVWKAVESALEIEGGWVRTSYLDGSGFHLSASDSRQPGIVPETPQEVRIVLEFKATNRPMELELIITI